MPGLADVPPDTRTVYLGEFTQPHADRLAEAFERSGIVWWSKEPGYLSRIWEYGVRVFVDRERLNDARMIASEVVDADA